MTQPARKPQARACRRPFAFFRISDVPLWSALIRDGLFIRSFPEQQAARIGNDRISSYTHALMWRRSSRLIRLDPPRPPPPTPPPPPPSSPPGFPLSSVAFHSFRSRHGRRLEPWCEGSSGLWLPVVRQPWFELRKKDHIVFVWLLRGVKGARLFLALRVPLSFSKPSSARVSKVGSEVGRDGKKLLF